MKKIVLSLSLTAMLSGLAIGQDNKLLEGYFKLDKSDTVVIVKDHKYKGFRKGAKGPGDTIEFVRTDTFVYKKYNEFKAPYYNKELDSIALNCIDWWISTPIGTQPKLRDEIRVFIKRYSLVSMPLNKRILELLASNPEHADEVKFAYSCGIKKYLIINTHEADEWKLQEAGLRMAAKFASNNETLKKPSILVEFDQIQNKADVERWMNEKMK
jgi:hypothetical protein